MGLSPLFYSRGIDSGVPRLLLLRATRPNPPPVNTSVAGSGMEEAVHAESTNPSTVRWNGSPTPTFDAPGFFTTMTRLWFSGTRTWKNRGSPGNGFPEKPASPSQFVLKPRLGSGPEFGT